MGSNSHQFGGVWGSSPMLNTANIKEKIITKMDNYLDSYRVALEAAKGIKTIQEIAKEYDVHPVQVSDWKKKISEGVSDVFSATKK